MTAVGVTRAQPAASRVGLFGYLGGGNLGNDGSLEVVLAYLRRDHPEADLDAMCSGPDTLMIEYGIPAIPLMWQQRFRDSAGAVKAALKLLGKGVDVLRTASWVRRHDAVIVPGAGVLETTLPMRAWGLPYSLFLLCAFGRLFGTKVALVSVGANVMKQRPTRWLLNSAAKLAFYRSYRDTLSRDAMQQRGVDTSHDEVYPDLVFGYPSAPSPKTDRNVVGVGVMAYYGGSDDRHRAQQVHDHYVHAMKVFVGWLVDSGHRVRLFTGDNVFDDDVAEDILADVGARHPELDRSSISAEPISTMRDVMRVVAQVRTVVAIRYHNVLCALKLSKPTISISYSGKHDVLMGRMGLAEFCQSASSLDVERLIEQFRELESRSDDLGREIGSRNSDMADGVNRQFAALSAALFSHRTPVPRAVAVRGPSKTKVEN